MKLRSGYYNDMTVSFRRAEMKHMERWQKGFIYENKFCFDKKS
jgi:hypothetical protein